MTSIKLGVFAVLALGVMAPAGWWLWCERRSESLWQRAQLAARNDQWEQAEALLARLTWYSPQDAPALRLRAHALQQLGDPRAAIRLLEQVPETSPMAAAAHLQRGLLLREQLRLRDAEQAFLDCLRRDPWADEAERQLLLIWGIQRRTDRYHTLLWKLHDQGPRAVLALLLLAPDFPKSPASALVADDVDETLVLARWLEADPDDPFVRPLLARQYRDQGRLSEARAVLEPWLHAHPDDLLARAEWLAVLLQQGERDLLGRWLDPIPEVARSHGRFWRLRGEWLELQGRWRDAADSYRQAVARQPRDMETRLLLGRCLQALGETDEADEAFLMVHHYQRLRAVTRQIADDPEQPALWAEAARLCARLGRLREARGWFHQVLRAEPDHAEALAFLESHADAEP